MQEHLFLSFVIQTRLKQYRRLGLEWYLTQKEKKLSGLKYPPIYDGKGKNEEE